MSIVFSLTIILIIVVAYWALTVLPKQREYRKHIDYIQTLQTGEEIITYGGLIGTILELDDDLGVARIQLADNLEVRILTAALQRPYDPDELARNVRLARGDE